MFPEGTLISREKDAGKGQGRYKQTHTCFLGILKATAHPWLLSTAAAQQQQQQYNSASASNSVFWDSRGAFVFFLIRTYVRYSP